MTSRNAFQNFLDLLASINSGRPPRPEVREWFLAGADAWLRASGRRGLHEHLGITCRLRRDYLQKRQQTHLESALEAFIETRTGSSWELAGAFVAELRRYARRSHAEPGTSRLSRSLWLAHQIPLAVPVTRKHWFSRLKSIAQFLSLPPCVNDSMYSPLYDIARDRAHAAWDADVQIRARYAGELSNDPRQCFVRDVWRRAQSVYDAALEQHHGDHRSAIAAAAEWIRAFPSSAPTAVLAPVTQEDHHTMPITTVNGASESTLPIEERCKAEWQRDPALRDEFQEFETYFAYAKANAAGRIKVLGAPRRG